MAGFEGYSVGYADNLGAIGGVFQIPSLGKRGYSVGFSSNLSGGTIIIPSIGMRGYTVEKAKSTPRAIVRFRRK
jgi:hypothetical protein